MCCDSILRVFSLFLSHSLVVLQGNQSKKQHTRKPNFKHFQCPSKFSFHQAHYTSAIFTARFLSLAHKMKCLIIHSRNYEVLKRLLIALPHYKSIRKRVFNPLLMKPQYVIPRHPSNRRANATLVFPKLDTTLAI